MTNIYCENCGKVTECELTPTQPKYRNLYFYSLDSNIHVNVRNRIWLDCLGKFDTCEVNAGIIESLIEFCSTHKATINIFQEMCADDLKIINEMATSENTDNTEEDTSDQYSECSQIEKKAEIVDIFRKK